MVKRHDEQCERRSATYGSCDCGWRRAENAERERDEARQQLETIQEMQKFSTPADPTDALRVALGDVEKWAHILEAPPGHGTMRRPMGNDVASMTPFAAENPNLTHSPDCPGCKAREALARTRGGE